MKKNVLRNTIITGSLCAVLLAPTFSQAANERPILSVGKEVIPIGYEFNHWSEGYLEQLSKDYDIESVFKGKDLNSAIVAEDFRKLVNLVIDQGYDRVPDAVTREAVVYELARIWAEKTNQDLESIPVIKMLVYSDTHEIDVKYNHGITVAYMRNIAKGKGARIFDAKTGVTYGELAALVHNTVKAVQEEIKPGVQPIMEGRFETRGSYEIKDDKVIFDFGLMSHYTESRDLMFGSGQQFELTITDEKGEEVYRYSDGKFFTLALVTKSVAPGEDIKWQDTWDMTNKEGKKVTPGKYSAEIKVMVVQEEDEKKIEESQLTTVIAFELTEVNDKADIIKPESAKEMIKETADNVITAISLKDAEAIAELVHPIKGVRFTPYTYVSLENDVVFDKEEVKNFFKDQNAYLWGHYDGTGDEISLTPSEYYEKFVYSTDYKNAEKIGYNEVLSTGNMLENQFEVYENAIVVEYYFSGFNPEYAGMDWRSIRLVFEQYEGSWNLVGIIHNQWTI